MIGLSTLPAASSISNFPHQQQPCHSHSACDDVYYDQLFLRQAAEEEEGEDRKSFSDCHSDELLTTSSSASRKSATKHHHHQQQQPHDDDDEVSVYHDVVPCLLSENEDIIKDDDYDQHGESCCGGTIIASLSSRDVRRNIEDSMILSNKLSCSRKTTNNQPILLTNNNITTLNDMETIQSDCNNDDDGSLSFTPTMAMAAEALPLTPNTNAYVAAVPPNITKPSPSSSSYHRHHRRHHHDHYYTTVSTTAARSKTKTTTTASRNGNAAAAAAAALSSSTTINTLGITDLQPERVACPFCDREKDLQWRLSHEQKQSHDLKLSQVQLRFVLVATVVTAGVAIVSFFVGKVVSDIQAEKVIAQYMTRCNDMVSQRDEEEMYWKLVTAAFSGVINAAAGPAANFVFGGGNAAVVGKR